IPPRPERLKYPPLTYDAPVPAEYRVELKSGPVAYVVPDEELPLVNVLVYVRAGQYLVPAGKEGLADLAGYLLARGGTKTKTAEELEERLAFLAAQLNSSVAETQGSVSLNLLSKDLDEGFAVLREVLAAPRFQDDKIALRKDQMFQDMKQRNDESAAIEARERGFLAFGDEFFANRYPTEASVKGISNADLEGFHKRWFHPEQFVVAVSGDFERAEMVARLEKLFADWPHKGEQAPAVPTEAAFAKPGVYVVDKDVNQGRVSVMLPGITRDDPDYFPVLVMNDILGGGGFTSRITNRVRSDEGLAYSASSTFPGGVYYPLPFRAGFQSKSRSVAYATSVVLEEIRKIASDPVTAEELNTARKSFTETFPRNFATKAQIATTFAQDELTGRYARDPEFWKNYRKRIEAVSSADVQRVARKFLAPDKLVILIIGKKSDIVAGDLKHDVKLESLAGNQVVDVPLRDPLTMQPLR
ncbi:MAG: M16 family metallopeptidase, partial [Thermoanaerobaculia bacterium]